MVGILIRMKLAILRHSLSGGRTAWVVAGGLLGLALAGATIWLSLQTFALPAVLPDVLALVFAMWVAGWVVLPVGMGGEPVLRVDHFALLPIPRLRLALGLLGAAFVSLGTAATLLGFASLVVYGARLGVGPALTAVPAVLLLVVFAVALGQVARGVFGTVAQSRLGAALTALLLALMLVLAQSGWEVLVAVQLSGVLSTGLPSSVSTTVRALPSGWGIVAVEAAHRSAWALASGALLGLAVLIALLLAAWSRMLAMSATRRVTLRGSREDAAASPARQPWGRPTGGTLAVVVKELRTWWRDPARMTTLVLPPAWALMSVLLTVVTLHSVAPDVIALLPWVAPALLLMAAPACADLYGEEGTALWLTLLIPNAARHDVRGRQ